MADHECGHRGAKLEDSMDQVHRSWLPQPRRLPSGHLLPLWRPRSLPTGKLEEPKKGTLTLRARMKSANLPQNAYLRLDVFLGNEVVVCPVSQPLSGVTDWTL